MSHFLETAQEGLHEIDPQVCQGSTGDSVRDQALVVTLWVTGWNHIDPGQCEEDVLEKEEEDRSVESIK